MKIQAVAIIAWVFLLLGCTQPDTQTGNKEEVSAKSATAGSADRLKKVLEGKIGMVRSVLHEEIILSSIATSNKQHADLSQDGIIALDDKWRASEGINDLFKNSLATLL